MRDLCHWFVVTEAGGTHLEWSGGVLSYSKDVGLFIHHQYLIISMYLCNSLWSLVDLNKMPHLVLFLLKLEMTLFQRLKLLFRAVMNKYFSH